MIGGAGAQHCLSGALCEAFDNIGVEAIRRAEGCVSLIARALDVSFCSTYALR